MSDLSSKSSVIFQNSIFGQAGHFRAIKNFKKRLAKSFRKQRFSVLATDPEALWKIQRRLDSS